MPKTTPDKNCSLCPRLKSFRVKNKKLYPDKFNAPVPSFGEETAELLIVGLAPGLKGANFTGRPFTGDYAGDLLYATLLKTGLAKGLYDRSGEDKIKLVRTRITNAVRCVPPENKPIGEEMDKCRPFLEKEIAALPHLKVILSLGTISHNNVLKAFGLPQSKFKFGHKNIHKLEPKKLIDHPVLLIDSYHCSRYNVNTGRLTEKMFEEALILVKKYCS